MDKRTWTDEDKQRAADLATGYVTGFMQALQEFDVDEDELNGYPYFVVDLTNVDFARQRL